MGEVLISGDLHVGHNDLGQPMLVDTIEANKNTPKTACLLFFWKICAAVQICQSQIASGCCDLENVKVKLFICYKGLGKDNLFPIKRTLLLEDIK